MYFKPLKSRKNRRLLIVLTVSFLVFCIWISFFSDILFTAVISSVSFILLSFMIIESGKFGWSYNIEDDGIRIKRTFKKYFIPFKDITAVKEISRVQAGKLVEKVRSKSEKSREGLKPQIVLGRLLGYSTVSVTDPYKKNEYTGGSGRLTIGDKFVLVQKEGGNNYILSPVDPSGFVRECRKHTVK